ncbi:MAG: antibiotic biosynthesis monooxygenase family protein [Gaiellaceae bacterium]
MFARIEAFEIQPEGMNEILAAQQRSVGIVRTLPGNMGGYVLVNRESGQLLNVTFWQSEGEREAAEREFAASSNHGTVTEYAIAMQEALSS